MPPLNETHTLKRLGQNHGGYHGGTIDIQAVLRDVKDAAIAHGWTAEVFFQSGEFELFALHRPAPSVRGSPRAPCVYISTGIHGDEPAGPLAALQLLRENIWPDGSNLCLLPCLNPTGFALNRRENADGKDLNRDYRHGETAEIRAHIVWLQTQPSFDLCLCLHEDWESHGFYLYELNPDHRASLAERMIAHVEKCCPIDRSEIIEGRPANGGIIRPALSPAERPQWPEAFYLITNKTRLSYTLEAPSDFSLPVRVAALVAGVRAALEAVTESG